MVDDTDFPLLCAAAAGVVALLLAIAVEFCKERIRKRRKLAERRKEAESAAEIYRRQMRLLEEAANPAAEWNPDQGIHPATGLYFLNSRLNLGWDQTHTCGSTTDKEENSRGSKWIGGKLVKAEKIENSEIGQAEYKECAERNKKVVTAV